jgi:spore germination protein GerM
VRKRRSKKKKKARWMSVILLLLGIGAALAYYYRHDLTAFIRPWLEKKESIGPRREVTLFFSDPEGEYLIPEKREIRRKENKINDEAEKLLLELIKGPQKSKGTLFQTLPKQTQLLSLQIDEKGVARVNFNRAFLQNHPGGSSAEMMTVYSVVNTLTLNLPGIHNVLFQVEGKGIESIAGHLSLRNPVSAKPDLIKGFKKKETR